MLAHLHGRRLLLHEQQGGEGCFLVLIQNSLDKSRLLMNVRYHGRVLPVALLTRQGHRLRALMECRQICRGPHTPCCFAVRAVQAILLLEHILV